MKNRGLQLLSRVVISSSLLFTFACSSPASVCKKAEEIRGSKGSGSEEENKKRNEKRLEECTDKLQKIKDKKPEAFKCIADCVKGATDKSSLHDCDKKCKPDD